MKRTTTGIVAAVLAMSATAALAQSKPPLKLGGILDMSEPLCRYHRAGLGDGREDGGGGFRRRSAGPQDRDHRGRSSEQGRPFRQHRPRHAGQSGRRDAVRRRGVRHRARRRRDRESAQQDRDLQRSRLDPAQQRGLRPLHGPLCVRHLRPGQCDRPCRRQAGPRQLVLPDRRLCLRPGSRKGHHQRGAEVRRQGAGRRAASAQHVGFLLLPAAGAGFEGQGDRAGQCRRRHRQRASSRRPSSA